MGKKALAIFLVIIFVAGYMLSAFITNPGDRFLIIKLVIFFVIMAVIIVVGLKIKGGDDGETSWYGE